jgi:hypothetical protein
MSSDLLFTYRWCLEATTRVPSDLCLIIAGYCLQLENDFRCWHGTDVCRGDDTCCITDAECYERRCRDIPSFASDRNVWNSFVHMISMKKNVQLRNMLQYANQQNITLLWTKDNRSHHTLLDPLVDLFRMWDWGWISFVPVEQCNRGGYYVSETLQELYHHPPITHRIMGWGMFVETHG